MVYTGDDALFEWDDANIEHIARHGISPEEAEEALLDVDSRSVEVERAGAERRAATLGRTESGRVLMVITTQRAGRLRVVTARNANERERRRYRGT